MVVFTFLVKDVVFGGLEGVVEFWKGLFSVCEKDLVDLDWVDCVFEEISYETRVKKLDSCSLCIVQFFEEVL